MNIKPLYDRILVKRLDSTEEKIGSIVVPDSAKKKLNQGEVLAVGKGKRFNSSKLYVAEDKIQLHGFTIIPLEVKVGDKVIFGEYAGADIKYEEAEFIVLKEDEVFGILE